MKRIALFLLLWVSIYGSLLFAQSLENQFDDLVDLYFHEGPGHAILIEKEGVILYEKAFGMADLEQGEALRTDHVFSIGSLSKQFTAVAILKLVESGELTLEDTVNKWVPACSQWGDQVKVKHLLSHTAGIPSYTGLAEWKKQKLDSTSLDQLMNYFKNESLNFPSGSQFEYSNSGYILLGKIIEIASRKTYEEYLKSVIFAPLNLSHTRLDHADYCHHKPIAYEVDENGDYQITQEVLSSQTHAAGGLISTLADLQKWNQAIFENRFLAENLQQQAHQAFRLSDGSLAPYGFGWFIHEMNGYRIIRHGGEISGFVSASAYIPEEGLSIIILTNTNTLAPDILIKKLAATALGETPNLPKVITVPEEILELYTGQYQLQDGEQFQIRLKNGQLIGQGSYLAPTLLIPIQNNIFVIPALEAKIQFNNRKNSPAQSLRLYENGQHQIAKKVSLN